jgi:hypothetical protein
MLSVKNRLLGVHGITGSDRLCDPKKGVKVRTDAVYEAEHLQELFQSPSLVTSSRRLVKWIRKNGYLESGRIFTVPEKPSIDKLINAGRMSDLQQAQGVDSHQPEN